MDLALLHLALVNLDVEEVLLGATILNFKTALNYLRIKPNCGDFDALYDMIFREICLINIVFIAF